MKKLAFFFPFVFFLFSCNKQASQADQFVGTWTMVDSIVQAGISAKITTKTFEIGKLDDNTLAVKYFPVDKMYFPLSARLGEDKVDSEISKGKDAGDAVITDFTCYKKSFSEFTYSYTMKIIGSNANYTHRGRCLNNSRSY